MRGVLSRIRHDRGGVAAVETALMMPIIFFLLLAAFEMGKYFLDEHVVMKAVRDGARYAARQKFIDMPCGGAPVSSAETKIKNVVQYGDPNGSSGGTVPPRLYYWTSNSNITIQVICDTTGAYSGIYAGLSGGAKMVRVKVGVDVPLAYDPLFGAIGFNASSLNMMAQSEAAVMGI